MNIKHLITAEQQPTDALAELEQHSADLACLQAFPIIYEAVNMYIKDRAKLGDLLYQIAHIQETYQAQMIRSFTAGES